MDKDIKILVLSALLHDIGKFAQRAGRPLSNDIAPEHPADDRNNSGYRDVAYSDYFIRNDLPLPRELEKDRSAISKISSAYHRPDQNNLSEMSIMIADRLSAGGESTDEDDAHADFREGRLVSVFDRIELYNHTFSSPGRSFYDLGALDARNETTFPKEGLPKGDAEACKSLFERFVAELGKININIDFRFYLESLISLLEKYTWCIPLSSAETLSDTSLFDHAFSTSNIAQSLYLYHLERGDIPRIEDEETKFIFLAGNLSGIQDYIFGISKSSGRGVSKIFRARSFFLQALTRSIVLEIQNRFSLTSVCRLIDSGGKFILLLPFTSASEGQLALLDEQIQTWFRSRFKGLLTMNLSFSVRASQKDFLTDNFHWKIDEVNDALQTKRLRKLWRTFAKDGPIIHEGYNETEGGNCSLCGINAADNVSSKKYREKEHVETEICKDCCDQIVYLGTHLPKRDYLIFRREDTKVVGVSLFGEINLELSANEPSDLTKVLHVETLSDTGIFFRARIARHLPKISKEEMEDKRWYDLFSQDEESEYIKPDQPKTFEMIAQKSKKELNPDDLVGRPLLGFFKADVDNLGLIFGLGLGNRLSVARLSSASRMLNFFFSDYIVELAKNEFPDIYVVFAGGDDLFMVGPWNLTLRFAVELRKKLSLYCGNNPDITLSGGILIAKARLPMRKAVQLTEYHLELAKAYRDDNRHKDSLCMLGETVSWQDIQELLELGMKFDRAIEEKERTSFSMAFFYRLLEYHNMYRKFVRERKINFGRYLSLAHYDIARNILDDKGRNQEEVNMLYDIFAVGVSERPELDRLNIPLFYAINRNRKQ